jgi:branched-chain amino acid transport system permease protein
MEFGLFAQYTFNGLMLGVVYAMVAVGFTLFFGVLDIIQFSHGDVLMAGAFAGLASFLGMQALGIHSPVALAVGVVLAAGLGMALLGAVVAKYFVLPLRNAPSLNTLLITLMLGSVLRELVRLFFPGGSEPQPFPRLLPGGAFHWGGFTLQYGSALLLIGGALTIVAVDLVVTRTKLGLAIRAIAQDGETAKIMGINFERVVLITFALGSALGGLGGVVYGFYYSEINFNIGLLLGIIGFSAAIVGGLGNIYGAVIGGFLFAALQTIGSVALPFSSAYNNVFAFAAIIILIAWKPTGLIPEKTSERV